MKKLLFVVASEGFQSMEYNEPKKILEAAGVQVVTTSSKVGRVFSAHTNEEIQVEIALENINVDDFDGVFFIGGPGALDHLDNKQSYRVLKDAADKGKLYGSICISTRILAHAGVIIGKKATGWNGDGELGEIFQRAQGFYVEAPVVTDGNLITATGPSAASAWGAAILEKL